MFYFTSIVMENARIFMRDTCKEIVSLLNYINAWILLVLQKKGVHKIGKYSVYHC